MSGEIVFTDWILVLAGTYFIIRNVRLLRDDDYLTNYLQKSHKGQRYVKEHGLEKAFQQTRRVYAPLGLVVSCLLATLGLLKILGITLPL